MFKAFYSIYMLLVISIPALQIHMTVILDADCLNPFNFNIVKIEKFSERYTV